LRSWGVQVDYSCREVVVKAIPRIVEMRIVLKNEASNWSLRLLKR
jgi:hypothetical protein